MGQLYKNVASQKVRVFAFADAGHATLDPGEPVTGDAANISAYTAADNAALGASNDVAPTEVDATNAPGAYEFDATQGETNGDVIEWYPKSSTAGVQVVTIGGNVQRTMPQYLPDFNIASDGDFAGNVDGTVATVTTLTGHTAQTGDSFARIGATGSGLTTLATAAALTTAQNDLDTITGADGVIIASAEDHATATALATVDSNVDTILTGAAAAKYDGPDGPGVYFDDSAANTNTTLGTDGTQANPVSTIAAAVSLVGSLGSKRIYVTGSSTLALTGQTLTDYQIVGIGVALSNIVNLGTAASPSVLTNCHFENVLVYGTHDLSDRIEIVGGYIDDAPAAEITKMHVIAKDTGLNGDFTLDTSTDNIFEDCFSGVAGNAYPTCNATGASGTVVFRHYSGGIGFESLSASHTLSVEADGQVVFESGCNVNAAVTLRGMLTITDNTAGMSALTTGAAFGPTIGTPAGASVSADIATIDSNVDAVLVDTGTTIPATLGTPVADLATDIAGVQTDTTAIVADTNELQTDWADGGRLDLLIDSIVSALTGTLAEATSVPAATASMQAKLNYVFLEVRNKITQTATTKTVFADDGSTTVATATVSDDGTTFTKGELA